MLNLFPKQHTWRGFLLNVATIAIAALLVLGAINLFEYLHDPHPARPTHSQDSNPSQPLPEATP
jgi:hypothetical protein